VPLAGSPVVLATHPASLINAILYGMELPPSPFSSGREQKGAYGDKLRDEEVAAMASYIRASWGNSASKVSVDQVARQR